MLILGLILFGMLIGALAQLILGRKRGRIDWTMAIIAGLVGSFVGGLLASLLSGDGLELRPSGIIGSIVGAHHRDRDLALRRRPLQGLTPVRATRTAAPLAGGCRSLSGPDRPCPSGPPPISEARRWRSAWCCCRSSGW